MALFSAADGLVLRTRAPRMQIKNPFGGDFKNPFARKEDGATTIAVTLLFRCEDRGSRSSILGQVDELAAMADTSTSDGISRLCGDTALALLRQKNAWLQSCTTSEHRARDDDALRVFDMLAIREAAKFDGLEDGDTIDAALAAAGVSGGESAPPTNAVVCAIACLMGDRTRDGMKPSSSGDAVEMKAVLEEMAAAANGEEEVFAFELFWVPGGTKEVVDMDQVMLDWPELMPC